MNTEKKITRVVWLMGGKLTILLVFFLIWTIGSEQGWFKMTDDAFKTVLIALIILSIPFTIIVARYLSNLLLKSDLDNREAEEKLGDYTARLNSFIEYPGHVSIYSLDRNFCYTGFNSLHQREMKEVFNSEVEIGKSILNMLPQDWAERAINNYEKALEGEHFQVTSL